MLRFAVNAESPEVERYTTLGSAAMGSKAEFWFVAVGTGRATVLKQWSREEGDGRRDGGMDLMTLVDSSAWCRVVSLLVGDGFVTTEQLAALQASRLPPRVPSSSPRKWMAMMFPFGACLPRATKWAFKLASRASGPSVCSRALSICKVLGDILLSDPPPASTSFATSTPDWNSALLSEQVLETIPDKLNADQAAAILRRERGFSRRVGLSAPSPANDFHWQW